MEQEQQRSPLQSFQRLLSLRNVQGDGEATDTNLKHLARTNPLLRKAVARLLDDYQRKLDSYKLSRISKRDTLTSEDKRVMPDGAEQSGVSTSHLRSLFRPRHSSRRRRRHHRRRYSKEKVDRSGWGGAYG